MKTVSENEPTLVERLEAFQPHELHCWLAAVLRGEISGVPGAARAGYLPHSLIVEVFPNLSPGVRQGIVDSVCRWVQEMARNPESDWRNDAGDELLLLSQKICATRLIECYLRLAADLSLIPPDQDHPDLDLHHRALQSLVAAGWRGQGDWQSAVEFWKQEAWRCSRYAGTAFDGLALVKPDHAIELIAELGWNGNVPTHILRRLRWLLDQWGPAIILPVIHRLYPRFVEPARTAIVDLLKREGLSFQPPKVASRAIDFGEFFARKHILPASRAAAGL